jgi:hypothetical protein
MGQFSMKITPLPGSLLGENQHAMALAKKGSGHAICTSVSQKKLLIAKSPYEGVNHSADARSMGPDTKASMPVGAINGEHFRLSAILIAVQK